MLSSALRRSLFASQKQTTGLTGVEVVPNAREVLIGLYNRTLEKLNEFPAEAGYRQAVEKTTTERLKVVEQEDTVEKIEAKICPGQHIELLIEQAEDELTLMPSMLEWQPWNYTGPAPEVIFEDGHTEG
eukprot:TRINITY_DN11200_c0_g1_i1.p1 TRINITY_DN11200_c0_g1~~TRINITY_DN11200_c0_g1_i1.p1  ORF type:complete len:137 (-),score=24.06 TRINITY_DN11200_c0_g1_i1:236-622(-)